MSNEPLYNTIYTATATKDKKSDADKIAVTEAIKKTINYARYIALLEYEAIQDKNERQEYINKFKEKI